MPQCPVCQVRYAGGKTECCPICGWDLQSYSLILALAPEVISKEKNRLEWAKATWARLKPKQTQIDHLKGNLQELLQTVEQLQKQLEQAQQQQVRLQTLLNEREATLNTHQAQLDQSHVEMSNLRQQLDQAIRDLKHAEAQRATSPSQVEAAPDGVEKLTPPSVATTSSSPTLPTSFTASLPSPHPSSQAHSTPAPTLRSLSFSTMTLTPQGQPLLASDRTVPYFQELIGASTLDLVVLPAGRFWMGSPEEELGRDRNESPRHAVTVASICMGRFPVTQAQWRAVTTLPTVQRSLNPDPAYFKGNEHPVEQVSWWDAVEFCDRLNQLTGRLYRLPSEAEWEYACRAETETPFHFGETLNAEFANYDGNDIYGKGGEGPYRQSTHAVGSLSVANAFGLSEMHGNVWEWCADSWHDTYEGAPEEGQPWQTEGDLNRRVLRGGAWYCLPELCRSAQRHWGEANHSGSGIGFRVVCASKF